jgi:spermidine synthase
MFTQEMPPAPMPDALESLLQAHPFVSEHGDTLTLHFRPGERQSLMSVQQPLQLELPYTKTMMGFLLMNPCPASILMIGLGGGSMAKFCYAHVPQAHITAVEINPHVIDLRSRFQIPPDDARFSVVCADGADFVRDTGETFDVIVVDGFDTHGQSAQLCSQSFYDNCCRVLRPRGILVINLDVDHPAHGVFQQRIQKSFKGHCAEILVPERSNAIVFAVRDGAISAAAMNLSGALGHRAVPVQTQLAPELQRIVHILDGLDAYGPPQASAPPAFPALLCEKPIT